MKLIVSGGGATFLIRIDGTDTQLELSKGLTAYQTAHEIADWLAAVTEPQPADSAPETQPAPVSPTVVTELVPMAPHPASVAPPAPEPALAVIPAPVAPASTEEPAPAAAPEPKAS